MKRRLFVSGAVNIPHQLPGRTNTLTDWQFLSHDRNENQNSEKGVKIPEVSACCL